MQGFSLVNKTVVYWSNISPEKPIDIFPTHSWINCGGTLREMVVIYNMHNVCRLWHILNDYTFTESKEMGEVVGSLPPHNNNAPF